MMVPSERLGAVSNTEWALRGKGPVSLCPESCIGRTQQTAVPRAESGARLVPLQQTAEIL